ncbi:MAG: type II toxin-antitoxin system VapC family toxin [Fimbriimonadaceae bacterium]
MIIPDINLLVYAYDSTSPYHEASRKWWEETVNGERPVGIPWAVILGFMRLVTHPRVFGNPMAISDAMDVVETWLDQPTISVLDPGTQHWRVLSGLLKEVQLGGKLVSDAHLAAVAREYRAELATNDRDFDRFAGIGLSNPIARS